MNNEVKETTYYRAAQAWYAINENMPGGYRDTVECHEFRERITSSLAQHLKHYFEEEIKRMTPIIRAEAFILAAEEVEKHWNYSHNFVNQKEQARRSADILRSMSSSTHEKPPPEHVRRGRTNEGK